MKDLVKKYFPKRELFTLSLAVFMTILSLVVHNWLALSASLCFLACHLVLIIEIMVNKAEKDNNSNGKE